jgi:hypothetical protein
MVKRCRLTQDALRALMLTQGTSDYGLGLDFAVLAAVTAGLISITASRYSSRAVIGFPANENQATSISYGPPIKDSAVSKPLIQEFKFPYEIEYWKRRARKTRDALVSGEGTLSLQQATPAEAPVAFLISIRATHGKFGPIEVRSFQDDLWWPVVHHRQLVTSSELKHRFAVGDIYFLSLLDPRFGWRMERVQKEDDLDAQQIERSTHGEMLAMAQSGSSQLLLCDDIVFMKGGEPVHICDLSWRSDRRRYRSTVMVVDPKRILCGGVRSPSSFGSCTRSEFDRCASQGAVFRADEIEKAKAFYAGHDATAASVLTGT